MLFRESFLKLFKSEISGESQVQVCLEVSKILSENPLHLKQKDIKFLQITAKFNNPVANVHQSKADIFFSYTSGYHRF